MDTETTESHPEAPDPGAAAPVAAEADDHYRAEVPEAQAKPAG